MSKIYPCVYCTDDGQCKKYSDEEATSWCVQGHCKDEKPSNADRIRAMADDELADFFDRAMETFNPWCDGPCPEDAICRSCIVAWLKEETKGDTDEGN